MGRVDRKAHGPVASVVTELTTPSVPELLHPAGFTAGTVVLGSGPLSRLASDQLRPVPRPDLVLLAPSLAERTDPGWVRGAVGTAATVSPDGLVLLPRRARRLRRELVAASFGPELRLLHIPGLASSRYVLPARGPVASYALAHLVPMHPLKRVIARSLVKLGLTDLLPATEVFRWPHARPLLTWLEDVAPVAEGVVMARSWRNDGAAVLWCFGASGAPERIVKVGGGAEHEAAALRGVATEAGRTTSIHAPTLVDQRPVGERTAVITTVLEGAPLLPIVGGDQARARSLLRTVADWLLDWNRATVRRRQLERSDAERYVLEPARRLRPLIDGGGRYLRRLEDLCLRCSGEAVPLVSVHGDLTVSNLLLTPGGHLGVVDWEESEAEALPLGDLLYATADFAAAVDRYQDRPAAFTACFGARGRLSQDASELLREAAGAIEIEASVIELCFHACWLGHADNERRRPSEEDSRRPFLRIVEMIAQGGVRRF